MKKLKNSKGETLIEIMVSLLIISFSVIMLYTIVVASGDLTKNAASEESGYYDVLYGAEVDITRNVNNVSDEKSIVDINYATLSGNRVNKYLLINKVEVNRYSKSHEGYNKELKSYGF